MPAIAQELRDAVEDEFQRRDRYRDAVTEAHVALGGDGVWRAHIGGTLKPPNSGHLHLDVPVMARGMVRERDELSDKLDETCAATADLAERLATLTRDHEALVTLYGAAKVERDELRARVDQLGEHLAGWCVAIDHVGADWDSWDEFYKNASCRPGALHDLLWPYLLDAHHEFALEDHYEWQRKNEPEALSDD